MTFSRPCSCSGVSWRQRIPPRGPQTLAATIGQQNVLLFFCCFSLLSPAPVVSPGVSLGGILCLRETPERLHGRENVTTTNIHKVEVVDAASLSLRHSCFPRFLVRLPLQGQSGITRQVIYAESCLRLLSPSGLKSADLLPVCPLTDIQTWW